MNFAKCLRALFLVWAITGIAACATFAPAPGQPAAAAHSGAHNAVTEKTAVNAEVKRDFDGALNAMTSGNDAEAEKILRALTVKYPHFPGFSANLGIVCLRGGQLQEAERAVSRAIRQNPRNPSYYNLLGIIQRTSGKFAEARKSYEAALRIDQSYSYAQLNIAILYDLYLNDMHKALQHYRHYQALTPAQDPQVNKWIVDLQQRMKRSDLRSNG